MSQTLVVDVAAWLPHCDNLQLLEGAGHGHMHCSSAAQGPHSQRPEWHVAGLVERTVRLEGDVSQLMAGAGSVQYAGIALRITCITQPQPAICMLTRLQLGLGHAW
jgi:hypothetical protein